VAWFRRRVPMTDKSFRALSARAKRRAFAAAGVAHLRLATDVHEALERAVRDGVSLSDFKRQVREKLERAWDGTVATPGWRVETLFRTNVQMAYSAGRWRQLRDPAVLEARPYWRFVAILDGRQTPTCEKLNGWVVRADSPWWDTHLPPLHFNCRSTVVPLSRKAGEAAGALAHGPEVPVQEGFGLAPTEGEWKPDASGSPPALRTAYREKRRGA
jgi:SPP1 gp7 family putative phage head morphogenesis protein